MHFDRQNAFQSALNYVRGVPKIMPSVLYFAEIMQFMHKTTLYQLSDHWLVTQVNISSTCSDTDLCTSIH